MARRSRQLSTTSLILHFYSCPKLIETLFSTQELRKWCLLSYMEEELNLKRKIKIREIKELIFAKN